MRQLTIFIIALLGLQISFAQDKPSTSSVKRIGVLSMDVIEIPGNPETITNILRLAIQKESQHDIIGRYDIMDLLQGSGIMGDSCYSQKCLQRAADRLMADQMVTGTVELIGEKIILTLRIYDAKQKRFVKSSIKEYVNSPIALQEMVELSVADLFEFEKNDVLEANLAYYNTMSTAPSSAFLNNGPRLGGAWFTGDVGRRMSASRTEGGFGTAPYMTQFGYQHEIQYMSAGNFQGLIELMGFVSGLEKSLFIPSGVALMGFRDSKSGFEFGLGASVSMRRVAEGFFNESGDWVRTTEFERFDNDGNLIPYPFPVVKQLDTRGNAEVYTRWLFSFGKTFRSGYLNIPVNIFASPMNVNDWMIGVSMGFNVRKRPQNKSNTRPNYLKNN
ncbi:MAG: hypothetical protein AAFY71_15360 [Bacteroidota bacterium]